MKRIFIMMFCLLLVSGCATPAKINKIMSSWEGHHKNDLIASWGPPTQIMSDGGGGEIFIYSEQRNIVLPGSSTTNVYGDAHSLGSSVYGSARGTTTYTPPRTVGYAAQRMFWINSNGYIYRWAWKGM